MKPRYTATITQLSHEGRGIATLDGKKIFIRGALPGETVLFEYTKNHSKYAEGVAVEILKPSDDRVPAPCPYFQRCGGCMLQHLSSTAQIAHKQAVLLEQLHHFGGLQPTQLLPPLIAQSFGYRRKARLGVKNVIKKQSVLVGFREINGRCITEMDACPILVPPFNQLIQPLRDLIEQMDAKSEIPQIEIAAGDTQAALIVRHLVPLTSHDQTLWRQFGETHQIQIYLQPNSIASTHRLYPDANTTYLEYAFLPQNIHYLFLPTDFTQVNADMNIKMIQQAIDLLALQKTDRVLDLFCGLGNFSLPLARLCKSVTGIEGSHDMIERAKMNAAHNKLSNTCFDVFDLNEDPSHTHWFQTTYECILLDPPRTGAENLCHYLPRLNPRKILYVSCNPATLARDAKILAEHGFHLKTCGVMDMFPQTGHVEAMALFEAKI